MAACHAFLPPGLGIGLTVASCEAMSILHLSLFHGGMPGRSESGVKYGMEGRKGGGSPPGVEPNTYLHFPVHHRKCSRNALACVCDENAFNLNMWYKA